MKKLLVPFLVGALLISILVFPKQNAYAQVISFPAEINKSFTPISIAAGGISRLRVTIFNPNAFQLTNATWTDNLVGVQPGLVIANPVNLSNTCGGSVTAVAGATTLSLNGGAVPPQSGVVPGSCTVAIDVTSVTAGNLINTLPANALTSTGDGTTISNTSSASATLNVGGVLPPSVRKSFNSATIWAGEISRLSIVITNNDPSRPLTQASLQDDLPNGVTLANPVSPTLSGCGTSATVAGVSGGTTVTLNNGTIAPGSTCTITVNVTSNAQGVYTNRIPASTLQTQEGLTNTVEAVTRLNVQEIGVSKRFDPPTFVPGATTTLIITLQNSTTSAYTGVNLTDPLPVPLIASGVTENTCGGTISISPPTTVSLTGGTIPAGSPASPGVCSISIEITTPAGTSSGTLRNTIPVGGLTTDQGIGNLRPVNANVIVSGTEVAGIKSFSPSTILAGGSSRLRIDIFAPSDTDLTNFSITDNLPAGVTVSNSTPPTVTGCGAAPPLVFTAPTGATSISLTNGLVASGQRCRIDVYVTGSTLGLYTNTISPTQITNNENRVPVDDLTSTLTVTGDAFRSIAIVKGFEPLTVFGGSASTMSIELINQGTVVLTGIGFTDNMPDGMILANPVNFNIGTCGGTLTGSPGDNSFTFSGGSLPALGRCTLTLSATMTVNGNLTNTVPSGAVTTTNGLINADPAQASLTNLPGASISKYFASNPITVGSVSALNITIKNTGNIPLSGLGFSDSLPDGLFIAGGSASAPVNNCGGTLTAVADTQLIELTNGLVGDNSTCTVVISITGNAPGAYRNTIPVGNLISDSDATNNLPATDTLVITTANPDTGNGGPGRGRDNGPSTTTTSAFLIPVTGFAPGMMTRLDPSYRPSYEATGLLIEIPVLNVRTSIVGVEYKKGNWDVSWLQDQVGWLNRTAYPTWDGNSLLTAHVAGADGRPGVFSRLGSLGLGEYVFVYNEGYRYTYQIVATTAVVPNDAS